eukprot:g25051.t1
MQQEIIKLRTEAKEFQNTRCFQCGLTLDVPAVHFFCGHSYHSYCTPSDGTCPKCSSGALPKLSLKEQREAQARNVEDFFKYLQGGAGDRGVQAMGEWCKFGAFDAAQIDPEDVFFVHSKTSSAVRGPDIGACWSSAKTLFGTIDTALMQLLTPSAAAWGYKPGDRLERARRVSFTMRHLLPRCACQG